MKKLATFTLIALLLCIALGAFSNSTIYQTMPIQNNAIRTALTHDVEHIYQMNFFDVVGSQYLQTAGNDTVTLTQYQENINATGHYKALYSFPNESVHPSGWAGSGAWGVMDELTGHKKILGLNNCATADSLFTAKVNGTIEYYVMANNVNLGNYQVFMYANDFSNCLFLLLYNYKFYYADPDNHEICGASANVWYHIQIDFNCSLGWHVFINDVRYPTEGEYNFTGTPTSLHKTYFESQDGANSYIDAVDYSWASGYYLNRNKDLEVDNVTLCEAEGSYVSQIIDLGVCSNYFVEWLNLSFVTPSDSILAFYVRSSDDNITWGVWYDFTLTLNIYIGAPSARFNQFSLNLTASSDYEETPEVYSFAIQFSETIANEYPQLGTIEVTFDNDTMQATISMFVTDPDNDTMDVYLCNISLYVLQSSLGNANGTIVAFLMNCTYSTEYEFVFNVTDGEDSVQSSTFGFTTGAEPEPEPEIPIVSPTVFDWMIVLFGSLFMLLIAVANKKSPK